MAPCKLFTRLNKACFLLIGISGMERFAYKGVASNLVTYLTDVMEMSNSSAAKFVNSWVGFTSMLPLVVATVADSYCREKYYTILASSLLYTAGLLALTSTAVHWPWIQSNKFSSITSLSWSLYMISLGQGGYNPSLQAFGADQLKLDDDLPCTNNEDVNSEKKSLFFQWWYFGVCCGSLLGVSVMSYVQDNFGWGLGFAIPTLSMISSILIFLCGSRFYAQSHDNNGYRRSFVEILRAIKSILLRIIEYGRNGFSSNNEYTVVELELQDKATKEECDATSTGNNDPEECLNLIKAAKVILRMLPVWVMLLMFAVIFQQPATFFTKQGMTMKRNIGSRFKIPPAALQSVITVSIIVLMPWYDTVFIPIVRVFTGNEKGISVMQRMGIGMVLSVIAMVIAAVTERRRRNSAIMSGEVSFSIFWLLPQYILLGISDIFTVVGMQEFFYSEVPIRMRTMGIALYMSVFGVGSFLSAGIITVIEYLTRKEESWFSDDMTKARLDKYYWFLALSSGISLVAFVIFCKFFRCTASS